MSYRVAWKYMAINQEDFLFRKQKRRYYSKKILFLRVIWMILFPIFRYSPRIFFGWRNFLLRALGANIGKKVQIYQNATIFMPWNLVIGDYSVIGEHAVIYNLGQITIGMNATISQRAHLCAGTHDYTKPDFPLLKPTIHIQNYAWICTDAFIGPAVTVGEGSVVGARAVVIKDVPTRNVVAGNPAKFIKFRKMQNE